MAAVGLHSAIPTGSCRGRPAPIAWARRPIVTQTGILNGRDHRTAWEDQPIATPMDTFWVAKPQTVSGRPRSAIRKDDCKGPEGEETNDSLSILSWRTEKSV